MKRFPLFSRTLAPLWLLALSVPVWSQEANEKAQRYYDSLLKRPVPGAAFDRFYGAWLDTETLESLEKFLVAKADAPNAPVGARLLLAYFYSRQSEPVKAVAEFNKALAKEPGNAEAWYQKAMASARMLDSAAALKDLEKATQAKPSKLLAAQIRQAQGRLLARQGQPEEARKVWQELMAANPDDEDLAEDLIELQITEGLYDDALASANKLLERTKDAYKRIQRRMRLGEIYLKSGKRDEAVKVWRSCLEDTGSDSWLEKEILSQLETAFRREDAVEPLLKEMADLSEKFPQRLTLRRRYARLLAESGDIDGAVKVFRAILELTPGERGTREAFVDLLKENKRAEEAEAQLRELVKLNPQDLELLARLADLEADNGGKDKAKASMELFLTKSDGGEASWLRVAAALDRYGLPEDALAQYQKTAEKFPDSENAREAWAVALHGQGKKDGAAKVWRDLAKGADASRLASVARSASARGEHELAFELLKEREPEFAKDPVFLTLLCDEAVQVDKGAEALPWSLQLVKLSKDAVDLESTVSRCIKLAEQADKTDELRGELQALGNGAGAQEKCLLAELLDRHADPKGADALLKSVAATEPELATALLVRLQGQRNDLSGAADSLKKLVESPGGRKSVHVQRLVELYRRAGKAEDALAWIPEWKKLSPGSVLPWQAEAELQFEAGKGKEALRALRQAAQEFEGNEDIRAQLASAYQSEGQLADAQRIYMALYEDAADTSARIRWAGAMAEVAKDAGKSEDLVAAFTQRQKANPTSMAPLLALAEIHRVNENYDGRRQALLAAVRLKPGDVDLLMEIARIAEREEKYDDALETLRGAAPLDKSGKVRQMITRVLFEAGREDEAMAGLREVVSGPVTAQQVEGIADSLISQDLWGRAADFLLEQLPQFPDNYRLHYYCAVALEQDGRVGGEFDPAAPARVEPEAAAAADGKTAAASRKTGAVDLFLKVRGMTKELPQAALPGPASITTPGAAAARQGPDYLGEMSKVAPAKAVEVMRLTNAVYQAYQYRQRSQRSRFSGGGMAGGLAVPPDLAAVRSMALAHLLGVSPELSDGGRTKLKTALELEGLPQPGWLMDSGVVQSSGGSRQLDFAEPLEKEPGSEVLNALLVLYATNNPAVTGAQLMKARTVLQARWPVMAQMASLALIRGETAEEQAAFAGVVDQLAGLEKPPGLILMQGVIQALYQVNNRRNYAIPDASRAKFAGLQRRILPWLRTDSVQRQNLAYVFMQLASGLTEGGDLTPLVNMLDEEIEYWAADPDRKSAASRMAVNSGSNRQPSVAGELPWPPDRLPDFPPHVLQVLNGQGLRMNGIVLANDPEQWKPMLKVAKNPVLRVLVTQSAEDDAAVKKEIAAMNAGPDKNAGGLLLAAALAGKDEDYAGAVEWLVKAQELPVPRDIRRSMDSAALAWALKVVEADPKLAEDNPTRLAGREAALRLRRENLNASQRSELADAFETLGLVREAERMAASAAGAPAGPRGMSGSMMMSSSRNRSQIQTLVDKGKRPEAVKISLKQLRDFARTWVSPNDGQVRYLAQEWVQEIRRSSLLRDLQDALREDKKDDAASLAQRAGSWDILGDLKTALPLYKKALELKPKDEGVRGALVVALLTEDPAEATPLIAQMDAAAFSGMANVLQNMSDRFESFDSRFALMDAVLAILKKVTPEEAGRQDLSWALYLMETVVQQGYSQKDKFQLQPLYEARTAPDADHGQGDQQAKIEAASDRRLRIHDALCRRMMELPGLAEPAFRRFAGVALERLDAGALGKSGADHPAKTPATGPRPGEPPVPSPEELDTLAVQVLKVESKQRSANASGGRRFYYSNNQAIRLPSPVDWLLERAWRKKDGASIATQVTPLLRQAGNGPVKEMELQQALYFCPDAEFGKAVGAFLKLRQGGQPSGEPTTYLETVLRIMNQRGLEADLTAPLVESVEGLTSSYGGGQELAPVLDYAEYLAGKKTAAESREFLGKIAAVLLSPKAKRADYLARNYQSNGFNSPQGMGIYRWIQMLRTGVGRPMLVMLMFEQAEDELMPYLKAEAASQSVLANYGSAFQRQNMVPSEPEAFVKFIQATGLTGDAASFRTFPDKRQGTQSPVVELLRRLAGHPQGSKLADALEPLPKTFGTDLLKTVLRGGGDRISQSVVSVLTAHLAEIQALPPERSVDFTVLRSRLAGAGESDTAKAFDEWSKGLQSQLSAQDAVKLLAARDAGDLAKGDSQLASWMQPILSGMVGTGDARLAESLAKLRTLVAAERKAKGQNQSFSSDGYSVMARMLRESLRGVAAKPSPEKAAASLSGLLNGLAGAEGFPIEWSGTLSGEVMRLLTLAAAREADGKKVTSLKEFCGAAKLTDAAAVLLFGPAQRLLADKNTTLSPEDKTWLDTAAADASGSLTAVAAARSAAAPGASPAAAPAMVVEGWLTARVTDVTLPLHVRMAVAQEAMRVLETPPWALLTASAGVLTESWKAGQPVPIADSAAIVNKLRAAVEKDPAARMEAVKPLAADLSQAWRKTLTDSTRGPGSYGFRPPASQTSDPGRAFLSLYLSVGDTEGLNSLVNTAGAQLDRGWLARLVAAGQNDTARRLVSPMRPGLQLPANGGVTYSKELAARLPDFLAGIPDERVRFLTETMLVSLPDPGKEQNAGGKAPENGKGRDSDASTKPGKDDKDRDGNGAGAQSAGFPDRMARLTALLERVPLEAFKTRSELEPLVSLFISEEALADKMGALADRYVEGDSLAAAAMVDDQRQRDLRCGLLRRDLIKKLKAGNLPAVEETLRDLDDAMRGGQNYYPIEEAKNLYPQLHETILNSWAGWKPEVRQLTRNLWLNLCMDAGKADDLPDEVDDRRLILTLFLYALEDDMKAFNALTGARSAAVKQELTGRLRGLTLSSNLNAVQYPWGVGAEEAKARMSPVFLRMLRQPLALPGEDQLESNFFPSAIESGWTSGADVLKNAASLLASGPQDASLPLELAVVRLDAGDTEGAAKDLDTAQSRLPADDHTAAAKMVLLRTSVLEKQGRAADAVKLLTDFGTPGGLEESIKKRLSSRADDLKDLAVLQSSGPEKLVAEYTAPLASKPEDPAVWMKLQSALTLAGGWLMDKGDAAAAANHYGMAAVVVSKLAARDPKKYTEALHAPAKGWQAAAKAAKLPGAPRTLLALGSTWKYSGTTGAAVKDWNQPGFDDSAWKSGAAPLGYGEPWLKTDITGGGAGSSGNGSNAAAAASGTVKPFTLRLRTAFETPDVSGKLSLELLRDDGAVIYLNGKEIARSNMPNGDIADDTPASETVATANERKYYRVPVTTRDVLVPGRNVLAVEIHQDKVTSSDLTLDLALHADDLEPWQAVQKLDPAAFATALGTTWSQLPPAFRDLIVPASTPAANSGGSSTGDAGK